MQDEHSKSLVEFDNGNGSLQHGGGPVVVLSLEMMLRSCDGMAKSEVVGEVFDDR